MAEARYRIHGENATGAAFRQVLGDAQGTANKLSGIFKTAFAGISVAAIAGMGKRAIEAGDNLDKFRQKARLSGEAATSLAYAAKISDVELAGLGKSLQKMQIFLSKAQAGTKDNVEALEALGLSVSDIKDLKADQQFELIAEQISRLASEEDQARAATEIFGKAGGELLPMFQKGAAGIREAREEAEKLGLTLNDEQLKAMADADDAIKKMDASWEHMWLTIMGKVSPAITRVLDDISGASLNQGSIDEQIKKLRVQQAMATASPAEKADFQARIDSLRALKRSKSGRRGGDSSSNALRSTLGMQDLADQRRDDAESSTASAAAAKELAEAEKITEARWDLFDRANEDIWKERLETIEKEGDAISEELEAEYQKRIALDELAEDNQRKIDEERLDRQLDIQRTLSDQLTSVFMHGKRGWEDMLEYWATRLVSSGFDQLLGSLFGGGQGGAGGSGGGMGIVQGEWDWMKNLGDMFGGGAGGFNWGSIFGYAKGGNPPPGIPYMVGEEGPEVRIDGPGTIIPNHALGGGVVVAPVYNIDARGASADLVKALPRILRANNDELEQKIVSRIARRQYGSLNR
jgi:hypothetical protein